MKKLIQSIPLLLTAALFIASPAIGRAQTTLTIIQPTNGATFTAPTNVQFDVSVYEPLGAVNVVNFSARPAGGTVLPEYILFLGSTTNWTSTNPPTRIFTFIWSNALAGSWEIDATAVRDDGDAGGSDSVLITIDRGASLSVDIATPTNGSVYPGPTNIQLIAGVAASNDAPSFIEFFDNSELIGTVSNGVVVDPPGSPGLPPGGRAYILNWTNQSLGLHTITASATDTNGYIFFSEPVAIYVGQVTNPPKLLITQPTNGSTFFAPTNVHFAVSVDDPDNVVASVQFLAGLAESANPVTYVIDLGSVSNFISLDPPTKIYMFDWSNTPLGNWTVRADALAGDGSIEGTATVAFAVEKNYSLSIDIASPTNGSLYPGPADIQLIAGVVASNATPLYVEFFDGAKPLGIVSNWAVVDPPGSPGLTPGGRAYFFDWTNQSIGRHFLAATVTDTNGNTVSSPQVEVFIGSPTNFPFIVRITSPPDMATFRAPVNVPLLAFTVTSPFDPISSVQFYAGTNSLGPGQPLAVPNPAAIALGTPFELTWSNAPPGEYALTALATNASGDSTTSAPVNITIEPALPPPTNLTDIVSIVATDPIAIATTNCWPWLGGPLTWSNWMSPAAIWGWRTNCGPSDAAFTVFRRGAADSNLTVNYTIGGTATNGVDYVTLPGSVTISAGQAEASITIVPIDVGASNLASTVVLTLEAPTNASPDYTLGFLRAAETVIIDNFVPRVEPGGTMLPDRSFHMWLNGPDGAWFHIDFSTDLINWTPLCTNQVINGTIDFIDPGASNSPVREYRAVPMANLPSE